MREEDRRYREYLRQLKEEEKAKEVELERLIHEEVEKMWQKRLNQWRLEREARKKLLAEVLHGRAIQLQDRCKLILHDILFSILMYYFYNMQLRQCFFFYILIKP